MSVRIRRSPGSCGDGACEPCHPAKDRAVAVIEHPPGDEIQWDWAELPDPPAQWG